MSKITLGKPPKTFAPVNVKFELPSGGEGVIECVFKYRSRKAFGEFLVGTFNVDESAGTLDLAQVMAAAVDKSGSYLADVLDSWSLDEKLTEETAAQLADEVPAAARAIMEAYSRAVTEGRLGN
ncbi:MAG: phage tail assembly chaperone [Roseateles sp.]|uniref:phage tail assembly chaperone n=1 Tax=Roseateles sp. TaxID=1971397 RepID=UPI004036D94D